MNSIGNYFVDNPKDIISIKDNIIQGKKYRFTLLTERTIRLEYNEKGHFEDRATSNIKFRNFPKVQFKFSQTETLIQLATNYFTLAYVKDKPFQGGKLTPESNLKIILNNTEHTWYYQNQEVRNFGGIKYSLDNFKGNLKLDKGLYSTDGFATLDDSNSYVIDENGNFLNREEKSIDIYVFMYKKDLGLCMQDYYKLTGYPTLTPRYTLGAWWFKNHAYTNQELEELLKRFEDEKIDISTLLLGKNSINKDDPFMINNNNLNITSLKQICNHYNIKLGITYTPQVPLIPNTTSYQQLSELNKEITGNYSLLPMNQNNLNIFDTLGVRNWITQGIDTIYIDDDNEKDKDTLSKLNHHIYAMYSLLQNKRIPVLTRNHKQAIHKDGIIFLGNTLVDWNTLSILPKYLSTASNNAISYIAIPIGGYSGGIENFELYIRYIQLGVFSPILILGSDDGKYYRREPWRWNSAESEIIKKYLRLRNKLIPYLYTENYLYYKTGSPVIQPLYYKYPKIYDEPLYKNQYFYGNNLLVCPIIKKKNTVMNRVVQRMFIPEGTWYELESGKKYPGNKYYMSFYKDEDYPVFARAGSIMIMSKDKGTELPINIEVDIFPGASGSYQLYEDDGISNNYKNGTFAITKYTFNYQSDKYELVIEPPSNIGLLPDKRNYKIKFKNAKMASATALSGTTQLPGKSYLERNDLIIELNNVPVNTSLTLTLTKDGMIENSMERLINDDIKEILEDLEIETNLKEKIDNILFGNLTIKKKRIAIRKLKKQKLEPKFIKIFLNLLEYIEVV